MSLMIAIATYNGQIHSETMRGIVQTAHFCGMKNIGISIEVRSHDAFIGKARSILAEKFLSLGFNDLLYVDADVGFSVQEVIKICKADVDIAMGLYRMKVEGEGEIKQVKYPALMTDPIDRNEVDPFLIKLKYGPAGFMRVRRPVFEAMMKKWPDEYWYDEIGHNQNSKVHDFFPAGRLGNHFVGEDISFCNRARECGFDIYAVQGLELKHFGEKAWPSKWQIDIPVHEENKLAEAA